MLGIQINSQAIVSWKLEQHTIEQPAPGQLFKIKLIVILPIILTMGISPGERGNVTTQSE
jgi:hypothetical protein